MRSSVLRTFAPWRAILLWLAAGVAVADYPLEIIDLQHRPAEELVPVLAPLAGADGTVEGSSAHLFVRADPQRLADIRRLLQTLDRPARNLLIQVRRASDALGEGSRIGGPAGVTVHSGVQQRDLLQEVRTLDGRRAFISTGSERPAAWSETRIGPGGIYERRGVEYRAAASGFYILPQVVGEQVTLEISSFDADAAPGAGATATAGLAARVTGRLGEWIPLGCADEDASRSVVGRGGLIESRTSARNALSIRVTELP